MIELYESISKEILKILEDKEVDDIKLLKQFRKRQDLIDSLNEEELDKFRNIYNEEKIYKIDESIKIKLSREIIATKKEIRDFKVNKTANSAYANMNKNNLNIFYKKV